MTVGETVKKLRLERGLTQEDLAALAGYKHKSSINKIETDQVKMSQEKIKDVATALGVTPDFLFYGSDGAEMEINMESLTNNNKERLLHYYNYLLAEQNKEK